MYGLYQGYKLYKHNLSNCKQLECAAWPIDGQNLAGKTKINDMYDCALI